MARDHHLPRSAWATGPVLLEVPAAVRGHWWAGAAQLSTVCCSHSLGCSLALNCVRQGRPRSRFCTCKWCCSIRRLKFSAWPPKMCILQSRCADHLLPHHIHLSPGSVPPVHLQLSWEILSSLRLLPSPTSLLEVCQQNEKLISGLVVVLCDAAACLQEHNLNPRQSCWALNSLCRITAFNQYWPEMKMNPSTRDRKLCSTQVYNSLWHAESLPTADLFFPRIIMKQTPFHLGHDLLFDFSENYDLMSGLFLALWMEKLIIS